MHAVNVYVRDQERSLRFFLDTLGFQVAFDARVESGQRLVAVAPPDGATVLTLIQPPPNSLQYRNSLSVRTTVTGDMLPFRSIPTAVPCTQPLSAGLP